MKIPTMTLLGVILFLIGAVGSAMIAISASNKQKSTNKNLQYQKGQMDDLQQSNIDLVKQNQELLQNIVEIQTSNQNIQNNNQLVLKTSSTIQKQNQLLLESNLELKNQIKVYEEDLIRKDKKIRLLSDAANRIKSFEIDFTFSIPVRSNAGIPLYKNGGSFHKPVVCLLNNWEGEKNDSFITLKDDFRVEMINYHLFEVAFKCIPLNKSTFENDLRQFKDVEYIAFNFYPYIGDSGFKLSNKMSVKVQFIINGKVFLEFSKVETKLGDYLKPKPNVFYIKRQIVEKLKNEILE